MLHVFERDLLFAAFAARPAQPRVELHAAGLINLIQRTAFDLQLAVKQFEYGFLRAEFLVEIIVQPAGAPDLDGLGDHHRPCEDGKYNETDNDRLGFRRCLCPNVDEFRLIGSGSHDSKR
jgi:hypothetical protein